MIAGDLFHRQPQMRELKEINYLFAGLTKTKVVLIAGNHDYIKPDSYYINFRWNENVYTLLDEELKYVEFPELNTCIYGFSYHQKEMAGKRLLRDCQTKRQMHEILLLHGGDEKHFPFKISELESLGYDYIALGHIHKPLEIRPRIRFAGALEPIDKNDTGPHGYIRGELREGECKASFVSSALRQYLHLTIPVDETMTGYALRKQIQNTMYDNGIQNIYKIILKGFRDPDILFDLQDMDSEGNIVELIDETRPAYDFEKLALKNRNNLLGRFIEEWRDCEPESMEYQALFEGVQAVLKTKRG